LLAIEAAELGDVSGKRILHLQCHIGRDTLSLAGRGAIVTGLDFSNAAIETAASWLSATFVKGTRSRTSHAGTGPLFSNFTSPSERANGTPELAH
jgi:2-polyprenyl-3-methyl-5-hydroxy-6-metoxy-1,4-benzoquinol methylase